MARRPAVLLALLLIVSMLPLAAAHEDGADGVVHVVAGPDDPRVGEMVDITYYLMEEGELIHHVNTDVSVSQNGDELLMLETTHEHDGVHHTTVRFTEAGPFTVTIVAETGDEPTTRVLTGEVLPAEDPVDAELTVDLPASQMAGEPAELTVATSTDEAPLPARAWVRIYREPTSKLVRRAELSLADGEATMQVGFGVPGTYDVQVEAYPTTTSFDPVVLRRTLEIDPGAPTDPAPQPPAWPTSDEGDGDGVRLVASVDPTTQVGPLADIKFNALVLDGDEPVAASLDYELTGPAGATLLAAEDVDQPDGIAEVLAHTPRPGTYRLTIAAEAVDGTQTARTLAYTVVPPTTPGLPGSVHREFDPTLTGETAEPMALAFRDVSGAAMEHIEADLEMYVPGEAAPRWTAKLHTHEETVTWSSTFPRTGPHYLKVNPSPQSPAASPILPPDGATGELGFGFHVDPAPTSEDPIDAPTPTAARTVPAPGILLVLVAATVAAAVWRRRTPR